MRTKFIAGITLVLLINTTAIAQVAKPHGQVPSEAQLKWHNDEFYLFIHFGPNTFTNLEWGKGSEKAEVFNPEKLDTRQWCRIAKQAGAVGIIITAKHHDGFCLWPSKYSTHTVRESAWRNGKGDVVKELSDACKEYALKFGVYLSPWDRNHPQYGTKEYNQVFVNMMTELFTNYGPIWEFWWDGANGEGPNGKRQEYDWDLFRKTIRKLSPTTVVFSDVGPDIRWVGNENGIAGETNWNLLNIKGFVPGEGAPKQAVLNTGNEVGERWIPAECDVSIRPGWFYHKEEDEKVKTPEQLFILYLKSVGRGANLLLNVPPDRRGLFAQADSASLLGFKKLRDESFRNNVLIGSKCLIGSNETSYLTDHSAQTHGLIKKGALVEVKLARPTVINCIELSEAIAYGQRIKQFTLQCKNEKNELVQIVTGTTIGHKRMLTFPQVAVSSITFLIEDATTTTSVLSEIAAYQIDNHLIEK